ncbi:hypothetical protein V8J82_19530 [Gymnodinialimonas sp. 2305UL16-5]|uniref:hypothetical protein n=1 Tax=Gymnodinialimonas mytili TaxID=3126503 RepID=UPI0030B3C4AC
MDAGFDRDDPVLWVIQRPGEEIAHVPLRALIRHGDLHPTTSGYVWIDTYTWSVEGWAFTTPDGQHWHLSTGLTLTRR